MSKNSELEARRSAAIARGVGVQTANFAVSADNATVTDADGRELIDFAGGIAVVNTGHRHPKVIAAGCCHVNLSAIGEGIALVGSGDVRSRFPDIKCLQPMEADG